MIVLSNLIQSVAGIIGFLLQIYTYLVLGRVIVSWVNADPYNPIVRFLYEATEPVLSRIRRFLPMSMGGIDFSPLILVLVIMLINEVVLKSLVEIAITLK